MAQKTPGGWRHGSGPLRNIYTVLYNLGQERTLIRISPFYDLTSVQATSDIVHHNMILYGWRKLTPI